jgi:putative membrane protein
MMAEGPANDGPGEVAVMMFWHSGGWSFGQVALMGVVMIVFLGLLIWVAYALVTGTSRRPRSAPGERSGSAAEILDERLARGEIDAEQHRRLQGLITSGHASTGSGRREP